MSMAWFSVSMNCSGEALLNSHVVVVSPSSEVSTWKRPYCPYFPSSPGFGSPVFLSILSVAALSLIAMQLVSLTACPSAMLS